MNGIARKQERNVKIININHDLVVNWAMCRTHAAALCLESKRELKRRWREEEWAIASSKIQHMFLIKNVYMTFATQYISYNCAFKNIYSNCIYTVCVYTIYIFIHLIWRYEYEKCVCVCIYIFGNLIKKNKHQNINTHTHRINKHLLPFNRHTAACTVYYNVCMYELCGIEWITTGKPIENKMLCVRYLFECFDYFPLNNSIK